MINGFFQTVQKDLFTLYEAVTNYAEVRERSHADKRIGLAALRVFSAIFMCSGALTSLSVISLWLQQNPFQQ